MKALRRILFALLAPALLLPAIAPAETVHLRDDSTLNARLVRVDGDTLTFRLSVGALVKLARSQVLYIVFEDGVGTAGVGGVAPDRPSGGSGTVELTFKDRGLSSKIAIHLKKDWDEHVAANAVLTEFYVDGVVAYADTDTVMDKPIYKGHTTEMKNDVELKDFSVKVPAGLHHCQLVVRNRGVDEYRDEFQPGPLNLILPFDNVDVTAGQIMRLSVGIQRGKLRLGQPKLYRIE
jgi:hypothetical protein